MHRSFLLVTLLLVLLSPALRAQQPVGKDHSASLQLSTGGRSQDFRWSIAGNYAGRNPNIYSELTWKHLRSVVTNAHLYLPLRRRWAIALEGGGGLTTAGRVTDADYAGDNRTSRTYWGRFRSDKGHTLWLQAAAAYRLVHQKQIDLALRAGYGYEEQKLKIREDAADSSVIATGLNSSYHTRLHGPFLGVELAYRPASRLLLSFAPAGQWLWYSGRANWNLVTDFKHPLSFEHLANGWMWKVRIDASYRISHRVQAVVSSSYQWLNSHGGDDILYRSDGQVLKSHFNGASGHSFTLLGGVRLLLGQSH